MATNLEQDSGDWLTKEESLEHAALAAAHGVVAELAGIEPWERGRIRRRPTTIYDINGLPLFVDYPVRRDGEVLGTVRTAASRVLGAPVVSLIVGPVNWDFNTAVAHLAPIVRKEHPTWQIVTTRLVCYSYPKLGVMFELTDEAGKPARRIYEVADYTLIPELSFKTESGAESEGAYAWSFYGALMGKAALARLQRYAEADQPRLRRTPEARAALRGDLPIGRLAKDELPALSFMFTRQLQFCSHYLPTETRSHHCFSLHAQQNSDYCAVATCQMILCYYRYYYSQDQIAPVLGYTPGNGCPTDQSPGYKSLSCNHLDASFDNSPTWDEASQQICDLHPFKSGIAHHARACAGVASMMTLPGGASNKKLYIYDPWPWNADLKLGGSVYWESWDAVTHTNYVFAKLQYPC